MDLKYIKNAINHRIRKFRFFVKKQCGGKSVICNNCTGAMMLHDLGYRLDTPTVNLWMNTSDYLEFVRSMPEILFKDIENITPIDSTYPVGLLDNKITLHFLHYSSFSDAITQWKRRVSRVDMEHIYCLCVDNKDDGIALDFEAFDSLPYKNKIAITYDENLVKYPSTILMNYNPLNKVLLTDYCNWFGKRYYDNFDFKSFFNQR